MSVWFVLATATLIASTVSPMERHPGVPGSIIAAPGSVRSVSPLSPHRPTTTYIVAPLMLFSRGLSPPGNALRVAGSMKVSRDRPRLIGDSELLCLNSRCEKATAQEGRNERP